jgi:hypothetical protein
VSLHDRRERFDNDAPHTNAKSNAQARETSVNFDY